MKSVFHISNCTAENQVKFATCTLHSVALTWWNTHVQTVGHEATYDMSWKTLMKMMTDKYCPRNEIRKLEVELWELKVKGMWQIPIMLKIRGALGQDRSRDVMSVEFKDILEENV
nr:reverse transcriptase domain-containing protein [Tanacetum cinerariifolium]